MGRPKRIEFKNALYHVIHRGCHNKNIFFNERDYLKFLDILDYIINKYHILVKGYCLLGNHYHLIIQTPHANLSEAMRLLNSAYAHYRIKIMNQQGPIFRGRYYATVVQSELYSIKLCAYVHLNPVRHGFTKDINRYRWSSYHAYLGKSCDLKQLSLDSNYKKYLHECFLSDYRYYLENECFISLDDEIGDKALLKNWKMKL